MDLNSISCSCRASENGLQTSVRTLAKANTYTRGESVDILITPRGQLENTFADLV